MLWTAYRGFGQLIVVYLLNKDQQDASCWSLLRKYKEKGILLVFIKKV
jgi:hypothetical protein